VRRRGAPELPVGTALVKFLNQKDAADHPPPEALVALRGRLPWHARRCGVCALFFFNFFLVPCFFFCFVFWWLVVGAALKERRTTKGGGMDAPPGAALKAERAKKWQGASAALKYGAPIPTGVGGKISGHSPGPGKGRGEGERSAVVSESAAPGTLAGEKEIDGRMGIRAEGDGDAAAGRKVTPRRCREGTVTTTRSPFCCAWTWVSPKTRSTAGMEAPPSSQNGLSQNGLSQFYLFFCFCFC